jgi:hypothetical protein
MNRSSIVLTLLSGALASRGNAVVQSFAIKQGVGNYLVKSSHISTSSTFSRVFPVRGGHINISVPAAAATTPTSEIKNTSDSIAKYNLIWSPNFWKKLTISLGFWAILGSLQSSKFGSFVFERYNSSHCHWPMGLVLPLLSSSCCAIQLIINAVSGLGCAGFNTVLGETR